MIKNIKRKKSNKLYYFSMNISIALLFIVLLFAIYLLIGTCTQCQNTCPPCVQTDLVSKSNISAEEGLAKCLTEKGAVMYGSAWCDFTKGQKQTFGDAFQYVAYVECTENQESCHGKGVTIYPTWVINDKSYPGEQQLIFLAGLSDCDYS